MKIWHILAAAGCLSTLSAGELRLHYKPDDHALGDVHPFFHEGECFLYYLRPGKFDAMLLRSRDSLHWTPQPLTHAPVQPQDWMSAYFVLGVFRDEAAGLFRSFHGHAEGRMASQTSMDLIHWQCAPKEYHVPPADYYQRRRDPYVFWIPEQKRYGCVMTTWIKNRPKESSGGISLATSPDLKRRKDHGIVLDLVDQAEPECPQMFQLGNRWYLLTSIYHRKSVGGPVYYSASAPEGPWTYGGKLDGKDLCAAQFAKDDQGRLLLYGWIPLTPATAEKQHWGGHLALVRELYALPDGRLATRLSPDIAARIDKLEWSSHNANAQVLIDSCRGFVAKFQLSMAPGTQPLRLEFPPLGAVEFSPEKLRILDASGVCWSEIDIQARADASQSRLNPMSMSGPMPLRVFVEEDRVEVFAADRYSLCARLPKTDQPLKLAWSMEHPETSVREVQSSLLRDQ